MSWNKGLTKETNESVAKHAESLKEYYKTHKGSWTGKKHSEETKAKISAARKKYLSEHPEKVPFKLNHSSKESYPEKYFRKWLKKENLLEAQELQIDRYTLDFAWPDKKIYLEIDGSQHKLDWMQEHDKIRANYLSNLGWKCIGRVDWPWYKALSKKEKHYYLAKIKEAIFSSEFIEKFEPKKKEKARKLKEKRQSLIEAGHISKNGYVASNVFTEETWKKRFELIINSNIDMTVFGWKEQMQKATGLTRRQLEKTLEHFWEYFKDKVYIRK